MTLHRGKIARHPTIGSVRPLTREDLTLLAQSNTERPISGAVKRFRDPHHRLARLFAAGLRRDEIVERVGYSMQRIDSIFPDPAFQELIAKYREKVDEAFVRGADDFYDQATANMRKAETMLAEKLEEAEENGEYLPTRELIAITSDRMDRFGYGKRQMNINVNADFAAHLEKTIARSGVKTIEAQPLLPPETGPQSQEGTSVPAAPSPPVPEAPLRRRA